MGSSESQCDSPRCRENTNNGARCEIHGHNFIFYCELCDKKEKDERYEREKKQKEEESRREQEEY